MTVPGKDEPFSRIVGDLVSRLRLRGSNMLVGEGLDPDFARQVDSILAEAVALIREGGLIGELGIAVDYSSPPDLDQTGRLRAEQNLHPAESLMAAEVLFDVALPVLASDRSLVPSTCEGAITASRALHHAIWRRFPPGAIAYADALRQRLSEAHQESRQRLSHDLHDRIAHGILSGIHRIELATMDATVSPSVLRGLGLGVDILYASLGDVRDIAVELRARVGDLTIEEALRRYLGDRSVGGPAVSVTVAGRRQALPGWAAEELFEILLESLRNARQHAVGARIITVSFTWSDRALSIGVEDDGEGFDKASVRPDAIGLAGMAERAMSIGARLIVDTKRSRGTRVLVTWPITKKIASAPGS